jgi:hypothetical protein
VCGSPLDLEADPAALLARCFDGHLDFANGETHRLVVRLPATQVYEGSLRVYFPGQPVTLTMTASISRNPSGEHPASGRASAALKGAVCLMA